MKKSENITLRVLAALITTMVVYVALRLSITDAVFSIIPGWHTIIYPPAITLAILTIIILATSFVVLFIFQSAIKLLTVLWSKLKLNSRN